jgi:hypothetical protein
MNERDLRLRIDTLAVEAAGFDAEAFKRLLADGIRGQALAGKTAEACAAEAVLRTAREKLP